MTDVIAAIQGRVAEESSTELGHAAAELRRHAMDVESVLTADRPPIGRSATPLKRRQRGWELIAGGGLVLLAVLGLAGLLLTRSRPQPTSPQAAHEDGAPPRSATVDLLPLIDPAKDSVYGKWQFNDAGELSSDNAQAARVRIPYQPPVEYDLRVAVTRTASNGGMAQIILGNGRQFRCEIGGYGNTLAYFATVDGRPPDDNRTTVKRTAWLQNGKRHESLIQVRKDGVKAFLDGQPVTALKTDFSNVSSTRTGP